MTLLATILACAIAPSPAATGDVADASDTGHDSSDDTGTDTAVHDDPIAGATHGVLELPFDLAAAGTGDDRLDAFAIASNAGTLSLSSRPHAALAYLDHDWPESGYHLYDLISIADDGSDLAVTYLYCQDGEVPYAYTESFLHPVDGEYAEGDCDAAATATSTSVELPALDALPDPFDAGFTISGSDLSLAAATGEIISADTPRTLLPFNTIDCTECPGGPWYEIHSLLVGDADACFGIVYLFPERPSYASIEYGICVPTLERLSQAYEVTWSGAPSGSSARSAAPPRPSPGAPRHPLPQAGEGR